MNNYVYDDKDEIAHKKCLRILKINGSYPFNGPHDFDVVTTAVISVWAPSTINHIQ